MSQPAAIERTVTGLGYELVDVERAPRGLLRVTIDRLPGAAGGDAVTVEDCEKVTRQLQHVLEVEGVAYERLEVSSPGLDRPLRVAAHYERFAGEQVEVTLKMPFQGRKKFAGVLQRPEAQPVAAEAGAEPPAAVPADAWQLVFSEGKEEKVLEFSLDEVREARLVPVDDFKGRRQKPQLAPDADESVSGAAESGERKE